MEIGFGATSLSHTNSSVKYTGVRTNGLFFLWMRASFAIRTETTTDGKYTKRLNGNIFFVTIITGIVVYQFSAQRKKKKKRKHAKRVENRRRRSVSVCVYVYVYLRTRMLRTGSEKKIKIINNKSKEYTKRVAINICARRRSVVHWRRERARWRDDDRNARALTKLDGRER